VELNFYSSNTPSWRRTQLNHRNNFKKFWSKNLMGRHTCRWEDNIQWILETQGGKFVLDSSGSERGAVAGSFEHGNEPWGSIPGRGFLD
jgi:hypothetical protein